MKKKKLKVSGWSKHSFSRSFENNTFESLILEIVRVDMYCIGRLLVVTSYHLYYCYFSSNGGNSKNHFE